MNEPNLKVVDSRSQSNSDWQARKNDAVARGEGNLASVFVDHALGSEIWDVEGKRYIDFGSGIAVCSAGHTHPKITAAVAAQLGKFSHTCVMVTPYDSAVLLAEQLNELAPGDSPKKTMFVTTSWWAGREYEQKCPQKRHLQLLGGLAADGEKEVSEPSLSGFW